MVLLLVSILGSLCTGIMVAATFPLVMDQSKDLLWFIQAALVYSGIAACFVIPAGFVWYAARRHAPYRYLEAVIWGVLVCVLIVVILPLVVVLFTGNSDGFGAVVRDGFLISLPALLTVAPLTVWGWHRVTRESSMPQGTLG